MGASFGESSQRKELVILESHQRVIVTARRRSRKSVEPIISQVSRCDSECRFPATELHCQKITFFTCEPHFLVFCA